MYQKVAGVDIKKIMKKESINQIVEVVSNDFIKDAIKYDKPALVGAIILDNIDKSFFLEENIIKINIWVDFVASIRQTDASLYYTGTTLLSEKIVEGKKWIIGIVGMVVYDEIPDFLLDDYNELKNYKEQLKNK